MRSGGRVICNRHLCDRWCNGYRHFPSRAAVGAGQISDRGGARRDFQGDRRPADAQNCAFAWRQWAPVKRSDNRSIRRRRHALSRICRTATVRTRESPAMDPIAHQRSRATRTRPAAPGRLSTMAKVRKRTWISGGKEKTRWVADYFDQDGKRHIKTFELKRDADDWLSK